MTVFPDEFKAEFDYLFQLCEELGESHPTLAPMLGRGADPSVTRLVEGLAFSFGRLRQRLDDDMPEVIHPVVDTLCPDLLRPLPSGTILQLLPSPKMISKQIAKAGSTFGSRPVDGVTCVFRSTADCEVCPIDLRSVEIEPSERRSVRLIFELFPGTELEAAVPNTLRLFFALPLPAALEARSFLLRNTVSVVARAPGSPAPIDLGRPTPAFGNASTDAASAFVRLRDYFAFPQRFAFLEIPDVSKVAALGPNVRTLSIELVLGEPLPNGITLDPSTVVLHAMPVVNVFRAPKLNVPLAGDKRRCSIRFTEDLPDAEVYSVERVSLVDRSLHATPIESWARFIPPNLDASGREGVLYQIHRTPSVLGPQLDFALSFAASGDAANVLDQMLAAEVELFATNGVRAAALGLGDVCVPTASSPSLVSFRNVTPVTRSCPPILAADRLWKIFSAFKQNLAKLTDTQNLAAILALANVPAAARWPDAKPDGETFVPLLRVERHRARATSRDELRLGASVRLDLDVRRFMSKGDVDLFGELVLFLFTSTLRPREWIELTLADAAGSSMFVYPRTYGTRRDL